MILMLIFLVLLLQRGVQASQPIPINVINLERDTARLAQVMSQLQSKGVSMKRVKRLPAVNGRELTKEQLLDSTTTLAR